MKNVIIFGTTQFAEILYFFLKQENKYNVCGFTVDKKYIKKETFCDLPVFPFENIEDKFNPKDFGIFICMGYTNMNTVRAEKFTKAKQKGYAIESYTHPTAVVLSKDFGEGNIIMENVTVGAFCKFGDGNVLWANAHIAHHTCIKDYNFFTISVAVAGNIRIGSYNFFGNNCTIKNGINIEDYSLIGAGCYLSEDTKKYGVYVPPKSYQLLNKKSLDFI